MMAGGWFQPSAMQSETVEAAPAVPAAPSPGDRQ